MGEQVFWLQITDKQGVVVPITPGRGLEVEFIAACEAAIVSRGVGFLKSEATVRQAVREGITSVLRDLKAQTRFYAA